MFIYGSIINFATKQKHNNMKHLIIGGVAGGATAAARLRRVAEHDEIILIEKGEYISYANCGLPYHIGGTIADREKLFVQTPESFGKRFNIDVRVKTEALSINHTNKTVVLKSPDGKIYNETYDKLLLSPGAEPFKPKLPGIDTDGIFTLRNVSDTDSIKSYLKNNDVKRAVVVGAGFIGLEMAENLHDAGVQVAIVEMADQVMTPIDYSMASIVHQHLQQKSVALYLKTSVAEFTPRDNGIEVKFSSGELLNTDMVILSIGVRPLTKLAVDADLKIGERGGIKVDEYLRTSNKDIFAVGDAIEYPHPVSGNPWLNYLAGPANRQARIAADNMAIGCKTKYEGSIGTSIAKVFDLTVATTGMSAKRLQQEGIKYLSATIHPSSHAGYYPGATLMSIKVLFSPDNGRLLGAQAVGFEGIDKRIDEFAHVIKHGGNITDLVITEHAYAPPYSSAKDPVALAGYVADNIMTGKMTPIYWRELRDIDKSSIILIDVRTAEEFATTKIEGAINIPLDELRENLSKISKDKPIVLYCGVGLRGYLASNILKQNGFNNVRNLIGGLKTYSVATTPISPVKYIEPKKESKKVTETTDQVGSFHIDACGLSCPGPIMKLKSAMEKVELGNRLIVTATDPGFARDAEAWCQSTGNTFISSNSSKGISTVVLEKGNKNNSFSTQTSLGKGKTFILFSDDLDKVLATFVLANGAAATGEKVSIFFTFWGLNAIKKTIKPKGKKDIFGKMFGMMLPSDSSKLKLSKMNMAGIGSKMMRHVMKHKNIESLETLRDMAIANGVEFIACQMSMDVMGINKDELLENATIGGVATYMNRADNSNVNLFI